MAKIPEVRIYFSWLLHGAESAALAKVYGDGKPLLPREQYEEWAENYRQEWAKYSDEILHGLTSAIGAGFYQSVIDVPCAPWFRAKSTPLIMNFYYYPSEFVDVLAHELAHVLLTDNTVYSSKSTEREFMLTDRWQKLFGEHSFTALVHIPVHALSEYLYRDVLKEPDRLELDLKRVKNDVAYEEAWAYVREQGYKKIIAQLKDDYASIRQELTKA